MGFVSRYPVSGDICDAMHDFISIGVLQLLFRNDTAKWVVLSDTGVGDLISCSLKQAHAGSNKDAVCGFSAVVEW